MDTATQALVLENKLSPGDVLVMTAAIESLHRAIPNKFKISVDVSVPAIFEHNPLITPRPDGTARIIRMNYPAIHQSDQRPLHFMQAYCEFLSEQLSESIPLKVNRPYVYLSQQEKAWKGRIQEIVGKKVPYWIINAGYKKDFTAKWYPHYQEVVNNLAGKVLFVQIGETGHTHAPLTGVINQIGKTTPRELIRLAYHAEGGLGPSTFLQHLCAAFEKPYVCLLGGREPVPWVQYPKQTTLHTVGALKCCFNKACWKSRTVKLNDGEAHDNSLCDQPAAVGLNDWAPRCLTMITPDEVAAAVDKYSNKDR